VSNVRLGLLGKRPLSDFNILVATLGLTRAGSVPATIKKLKALMAGDESIARKVRGLGGSYRG